MNTTRIQIRRIEKQIQALEAEAAALLERQIISQTPLEQIAFSHPQKRHAKFSTFKAPAQLH